jgi:DNA-binding MarR family transcriptional regulator
VKKSGQLFPAPPQGVPATARHETANALHSAAVRLLRRVQTIDVRMDLDGPHASALSVLVYGGPMSIGRLAAIEQVSPPAITKTVSALEADGLAERVRSDADRRVVIVRVTDAGRALLERGRAARVHLMADLLDGLSERDRRTLERAAKIIAAVLSEPSPPR